MAEMIIKNMGFKDINPLLFGYEKCEKSHSFGPYKREYYLIHYVIKGKGIFERGGKKYEVKKGEAFLIVPEETTTYTADPKTPWEYCWIGFDGERAGVFNNLSPVFKLSGGIIPKYPTEREDYLNIEYRLVAAIVSIYAEVSKNIQDKKRGENVYVKKVQDYIRVSYMYSDLKVENIAKRINLDRRYLSRIFKKETGVTLQNFIISVRMQKAYSLLEKGGVKVAETARLCGYTDAFNFSKIFKKTFNLSPAEVLKK